MYFRKMNLFKIIASPLALIYWMLTSLRNLLFQWGLLKQYKSSIPVVSVGNLSMGGTGKTPHVAFILEKLKTEKKAVISRGYGRRSKNLIEGSTQLHTSRDLGDEPMELLQKFEGTDFKMIVEGNRTKALQYLEQQKEKTDIVILDDGFQHQYAQRDLNILLTDYNKPFYTDFIVPMGTLRENRKGAERADIIIVTKCPNNLSAIEQNNLKNKIARYSSAKIFFSKITYQGLINKHNKTEPLDPNKKYLLVTGIANPTPIFDYLNENKIHFAAKKYSDHHNFSKKEIQDILKKSENCDALITTEKDWMRLKETKLPNTIAIDIFRLKIEIQFINSEQNINFKEQIKSQLI